MQYVKGGVRQARTPEKRNKKTEVVLRRLVLKELQSAVREKWTDNIHMQ